MTRYLLPALSALILTTTVAPATAAEPVVGRWRTLGDGAVVKIPRCRASLCGKLVSSHQLKQNPALRDERNKDAAQRGRPLHGLTVLSGFVEKNGAWEAGTIYNPEDGATYRAGLSLRDGKLLVKGCMAKMLCQTQQWTRIG